MLSKLLRREDGQMLVFTGLMLVSILGLSGIALDAGHGYYAYERLKAATNSATLAGAAGMPNTTTASANVAAYSSASGDKNFLGAIMQNVTATPTYSCSSTVTKDLGVPCETTGGGSGGYNAISVKQCATVPTWFGQFFGVSQFNICAQSMASMAGGPAIPYNIAIILDTTESMSAKDSGLQCSGTQITCALQGVQALLQTMYPCSASDTTCSSSSTPLDTVSLFVFPAMTTATVGDEYDCSSSTPSIVPYTFPVVTPGTSQNLVLPSTDTYQVIPFSNDYKTSDSASTLNSSSNLVKAAGYGSCKGISAPGGEGTYYAQAIKAAQTALVAEKAIDGYANVMMIITDGDATACNTSANTSAGGNGCSKGQSSQIVATSGTLDGTGSGTSVTYPSALGECGQAVLAANAVATAGTTVFTFAYGAETSGSCLTDAKYTNPITTNGGAWTTGGQACAAIAAMASAQANFYSDDANGCSSPSNSSVTQITSMFTDAFASLSQARLIPVGST